MAIPYEGNPIGYASGGSKPSWSDYIVYMSLAGQRATAETGQALSIQAINLSYTTYANVPCAYLQPNDRGVNGNWIRCTQPTMNQGPDQPRCWSIWMAQMTTQRGTYAISIGTYASGKQLATPVDFNANWSLMVGSVYNRFNTGVTVTPGVWLHLVANYSADHTLDFWKDGQKIYTTTYSCNIDIDTFSVGNGTSGYNQGFNGYLASARLWNRTLTDAEIQDLAQEHHPVYQ